uniref:Uncharacterized protein n=1 Tax=Ascaris lumbricoides TaxID=6252 RepID=A0A0M3HSK8_ASCLU
MFVDDLVTREVESQVKQPLISVLNRAPFTTLSLRNLCLFSLLAQNPEFHPHRNSLPNRIVDSGANGMVRVANQLAPLGMKLSLSTDFFLKVLEQPIALLSTKMGRQQTSLARSASSFESSTPCGILTALSGILERRYFWGS